MRAPSFLFLVILTFLILQEVPSFAQTKTDDQEFQRKTLMDSLKEKWEEVLRVSPAACAIIMLPVTLCFLFCACVTCLCIKCSKKKHESRPKDVSHHSSRHHHQSKSPSPIAMKTDGDRQMDPIPLAGLVNGHSIGFQPLRHVNQGHQLRTQV